MMMCMRRVPHTLVLASTLLAALPAGAADLVVDIEEAYAVRHLRRTPFDPRAVLHLAPAESAFLEELFALGDAAVLLNTNVGLWFSTRGAKGLHATVYLERMDALRSRFETLETPPRLESVRRLLNESLVLQRGFIADWHQALEEGRPFASQLTDEFAYHEGLHRSHRLLLKTFAELHALFPGAGEATHMAFHDHLIALDLK